LKFLDDLFDNVKDAGELGPEWQALAKHLKIEL
jgi:hypothetical protein